MGQIYFTKERKNNENVCDAAAFAESDFETEDLFPLRAGICRYAGCVRLRRVPQAAACAK